MDANNIYWPSFQMMPLFAHIYSQNTKNNIF